MSNNSCCATREWQDFPSRCDTRICVRAKISALHARPHEYRIHRLGSLPLCGDLATRPSQWRTRADLGCFRGCREQPFRDIRTRRSAHSPAGAKFRGRFPKADIQQVAAAPIDTALQTSGSDAQKRRLQTWPFGAASRGFVLRCSPPFLPFAATARFWNLRAHTVPDGTDLRVIIATGRKLRLADVTIIFSTATFRAFPTKWARKVADSIVPTPIGGAPFACRPPVKGAASIYGESSCRTCMQQRCLLVRDAHLQMLPTSALPCIETSAHEVRRSNRSFGSASTIRTTSAGHNRSNDHLAARISFF